MSATLLTRGGLSLFSKKVEERPVTHLVECNAYRVERHSDLNEIDNDLL